MPFHTPDTFPTTSPHIPFSPASRQHPFLKKPATPYKTFAKFFPEPMTFTPAQRYTPDVTTIFKLLNNKPTYIFAPIDANPVNMQDTTPERNNNSNSFNTHTSLNNEKMLEQIYAANYPAIEKFILANSGTREDAKDIYQEAFLAFWRNVQLNKFEAQHENAVSSYLMRIAKFKWIDVLRKNETRKTTGMETDHADESPVYDVLEKEEETYLNLVKTRYKTMGEPCKELLYRFYFKKEMMKQIAAHFSWTEATAKNNKYRCLHKLRNLVLNR
jgi:RNA polymerase sigma factor (sigma-70 family)